MDYEKEISFGAFDSDLMHQEITIPEGFEATIDGNKIILKKIESEDEKILKEIISIVKSYRESCITEGNHRFDDCISWLEKQATPQMVEDAFLKGCNDTKKCLLKRQSEQKPTDEDMKEALQTEYEKGRADAIAEIRKKWDDSKKKRQEVISFLESLRLKED